MKAEKPINPHPMVAKVAHLPKTPQVKAVKAQVKTEHPHKDKVDKAMAILKAVKVKEIPIVVRVKVMVAKVKAKEMAMVMARVMVKAMAIPTLKAKAMVKAIPKVEMKATHPKVVMVAKKVLKKEIPTVKMEMVAIPTPIMRVEIPPIPIQMGKHLIQIQTKMVKKATKVEILPKRVIPIVASLPKMAIPMVEIREMMERVNPTVHHSHPKMKKPSIS